MLNRRVLRQFLCFAVALHLPMPRRSCIWAIIFIVCILTRRAISASGSNVISRGNLDSP